jgi:CTP synthase
VAVQYHPEFKSRPLAPHPLFQDFVRASFERRAGQGGRALRAEAAVERG